MPIIVLIALLIRYCAIPMTALAREPATGKFDSSKFTAGELKKAEFKASGASAVYDPWLNGFPYRKPITITGSTAGAQTNYQIKVAVSFVAGKMNADFSDIRFTSSDGATLIDHWRESYTASSTADFWVEVPSIPASPAATTIYMYYGNSSAGSASNGSNTFLIFDDFLGSSLGAGWTVDDDAIASYTVANSSLEAAGSASAAFHSERYRYWTAPLDWID